MQRPKFRQPLNIYSLDEDLGVNFYLNGYPKVADTFFFYQINYFNTHLMTIIIIIIINSNCSLGGHYCLIAFFSEGRIEKLFSIENVVEISIRLTPNSEHRYV